MLRADAQDNRDRLLTAARALFSEQGIDVPMREVARRAGVGPATLYRRFPTRRALIEAALAEEMRECRAIVLDGCSDPDPWRGFCSVIERIGVLNGRNQGFVDAFLSAEPDAAAFTAHRADLLRRLARLARRAQAAGSLRADFVIDDLLLVLVAGRALAATPAKSGAAAERRFAALVIDAFRASDAHAELPAAPALRSAL